jgi:uncharacterized protein YidB (DUF937 family)
MSILDTVLDTLKNQAGAGAGNNGLLESVIGMVTDPQTGGLNGLIEKISQGGLAEQVASWVGTGANLQVSADQIQAALGSPFVQEMAAKFGINTADVAGSLANILPQVIDKLTPDGQVPQDNSLLEAGLKGLTSLLTK